MRGLEPNLLCVTTTATSCGPWTIQHNVWLLASRWLSTPTLCFLVEMSHLKYLAPLPTKSL